MSSSQFRRGKRRFDDDESTFLKRDRHRRRLPPADLGSETFGLPEGDRWSTFDQSAPTERGPQPHVTADLSRVRCNECLSLEATGQAASGSAASVAAGFSSSVALTRAVGGPLSWRPQVITARIPLALGTPAGKPVARCLAACQPGSPHPCRRRPRLVDAR